MAAGGDVPEAAERAFDASGGVTALAAVVWTAAAAADGVVLEAALGALAGTRLHTAERVEQARPLPSLLAAILTNSPLQAAAGASASEPISSSDVELAMEHAVSPGILTSPALVGNASPLPQGVPLTVPLTVPAAASAILSLYRICEAIRAVPPPPDNYPAAPPANGSAIVLEDPASLSPGNVAGSVLVHSSLLDLQRAMQAAVREAEGTLPPPQAFAGGVDGGEAAICRLPLWECVVIAGAIQALKWRLRQLDLMPWRRSKAGKQQLLVPLASPRMAALIRALPDPPAALVARGALTGLRPATLRMRLAQARAWTVFLKIIL